MFRTWVIELEEGEIRASVGETAKRGMQSEELGAENRRIKAFGESGKSPSSESWEVSNFLHVYFVLCNLLGTGVIAV